MNIKNLNVKCFTHTSTVNNYLTSIRKFQTPSREKERELIFNAKKGDKKSQDELINGHQRFVFAIAKRYAINANELIDYVNEGNIGLLEALQNFDLSNDVRFITYAVHYMRRRMNFYRYNTEQPIKQTNGAKFRPKINKLKSKFFNENGYFPTVNDLCNLIKETHDMNIKDESDLYEMNLYSTDYDYITDDKDNASSIIAEYDKQTSSTNLCVEAENNEYYKSEVKMLLKKVTPREAEIAKMLFGIDCDKEYTPEEVGQHFKLTASRVNMIKNNVISKIRCRYYANKMIG